VYKISECIDSQVEIEPVAFDDIANTVPAEGRVEIRKGVIAVRTFDRILRRSVIQGGRSWFVEGESYQ